jgi:hypothetical protein
MTTRWHGYIIIARQVGGLTPGYWAGILGVMDTLVGTNNSPSERLQKRTSLDGNTVIIPSFIHYVCVAVGISPESLVTQTHVTQTYKYVPSYKATLTYLAQPRCTITLLGRQSDADVDISSWEASRLEAVEYLKQNSAAWE